MFAIGLSIIILGIAFGIKFGRPGRVFNWADYVALSGVSVGSGLCTLSLLIWLWGVLP
jgi:hypothetical protein